MKYVLYLVLCLLPTTAYCQDSYLFDKVLEYEVKEPSESVDKDMETRFYFINTKDNSYVAIAIERADGTYTLVFRDDKKKKIAELVVDENAIFRTNKLSFKKRFLKDNRYGNLVDVNDYTIAISKKDSLTEEYTYTYKRGNWQNRYKTKKHVIIVDESVDYFMPGVGFGDYYSLLTWKEKFPTGLVQKSFTEKLDGRIISYCNLFKIFDSDKVFVFE